MRSVVVWHLYNDYSGSPKVLTGVLEGLARKGYHVDIITSKGGPLDRLGRFSNVRLHHYPYQFSTNPFVTMLRYGVVQAFTFLYAFRYLFKKDVVFYINTLLPIGPALSARLMGKKILWHNHENAFVKGRVYTWLSRIMQRLADAIVCVSRYQSSYINRGEKVSVVPNSVDEKLLDKLKPDIDASFARKEILMLGSLKAYKGANMFVKIARLRPEYKFVLVLNESPEALGRWMAEVVKIKPENLEIHPRQSDVAPFYNRASLVLNLSNPVLIIETFGLTAVEAFSCAVPVICPGVGGIAEIVENGVNGFTVDVTDENEVSQAIETIMQDKNLYEKLATNALQSSSQYSSTAQVESIKRLIERL